MNAVFLDTVGLLALWDRSDQWHSAAETAWREMQSRRAPVLTTTFILLECGNAAARKPYRQTVGKLRAQLENASLLVTPTQSDWAQAWQAYQNGDTDQAGIVDHVSFCVMRRMGVRQAFTNDRHFHAAGFQTLF